MTKGLIHFALSGALLILSTAPVSGDATRVKTINYAANTRFEIPVARAASVTLALAAGERISTVEISDAKAYALSFSDAADSITLQTVGDAEPVALNIYSDLRNYGIDLVPANPQTVPRIVQFQYADTRAQASASGAQSQISYRLKGDAAVMPTAISDDGRKTYMQWGQYQAMPAVFAIGSSGKEEIVEGYMRDGIYTIDSVNGQYVFRIDRSKAVARRLEGGEGRK